MEHKQIDIGGTFEGRAFSRDILVYCAGYGLLLVFGLVQTFIIPKYLSVEEYGHWQLFILYFSYVGIFHLGFLDGILTRWAGRNLNEVGVELKKALWFLVIEQLLVISPLAIIIYLLTDYPVQWIALMVIAQGFVMNLSTYFIFTSQALRKFRLITVLNVGRGFIFFISIVILFSVQRLTYQYIIGAFILSYILFVFSLVVYYRKHLVGNIPTIRSLLSYGKNNIGIGIFIMLGNFVFVLFLTTDRLLISSFFSIESFAVYAFAITITAVAFRFIKAISDVFFPYLSAAAPDLRIRAYQSGKQMLIISWGLLFCAYFPIASVVSYYLPQYITSLSLIKIMLGTIAFTSLILILHVSYYKSYVRQKQYFIVAVSSLGITIALMMIAVKYIGTLESVAFATLAGFCIWYIINELCLKSVVGGNKSEFLKSLFILVIYFASFWLVSFAVSGFIVQTFLSIGLFFLITRVAYYQEVKGMIVLIKGIREKH
ncbi:hypothetical protein ACFLVR_05710 [Chloroflexota bacterium]